MVRGRQRLIPCVGAEIVVAFREEFGVGCFLGVLSGGFGDGNGFFKPIFAVVV